MAPIPWVGCYGRCHGACNYESCDVIGDTASNLGVAMDELMRHQPLLRTSVMKALIRVSVAVLFFFHSLTHSLILCSC